MTGWVTKQHAIVEVPVLAKSGDYLKIEFVIDTGFVGHLTLPEETAHILGLLYLIDIPVNLADDSTVFVPAFEAIIRWNNIVRTVNVYGTGSRPLLGMSMLEGSELRVQCHENDKVSIQDM